MDRDTARAKLDATKASHAALLAAQARYDAELRAAVEAADAVGLPLWEIAERTGRHRNYVAQWTTPRRRTSRSG